MNRLLLVTLFCSVTVCLNFRGACQAWQTLADAEQAVIGSSEAFAKAFNAEDAKAISKLFVSGGEFIDLDRRLYEGREAVEKEFAASMKAAPGRKITIEIDSIRQVSTGVVIEDGRATVTVEKGPAFVSRYTAVHVLENKSWKLASLRDLSGEPLTHGDNLLVLQWLIGDWISESADGVVEHSFYWAPNGNFILGNFDVKVDGELVSSGNQRIGWDPQSKQIREWTFDSHGSSLKSTWTELGDRWMIKSTGTSPDGKTLSATNYYVPLNNNQLTWIASDRLIGTESIPDTEVKLVRKPPTPKSDPKTK